MIDQHGKSIGKTIRISNTKFGSEQLLAFFNKHALLQKTPWSEWKPLVITGCPSTLRA
ncbi:hypothetical protein [Enterococcus avium]|uniref:hypothetical protein n=1 Tax=Enterococcus avium TaxID=33945 RepID=UPI00187CA45B|nr:hypothetical protein [Enterococcus avium]